ncbi:MAG: flagellar biosynthesis protein FlhA [Sedimentisphaerales bacterium]|jgi:flagellar biosynthesis protein FlhA|nr:flagellar biosynthesis protein FlhA [Sedimentisphaerales bacterium]HNY79322.1 flagellar biosynthesis protein FlhA [Sedimentisphaerales bacterium]HOC64480.1 flagellar biosynthesis protein FlhA [Sedimentisphaerales bacterium]HOH63343.1 flagellar biosynthesis protein FlhA [Sedimentisphaerales bacterium]HPY49950.1 flagellar biosynthesis protein FlhA [Sedimentisphaerales bacterium]
MASDRSKTPHSATGDPAGYRDLMNVPLAAHSNIIMAFGLVAVLATLIIPLPTTVLDLLLACSISLAIAVLIVTLSSTEPLELSTFPSLLLFTTLFRLSLNVASTRLILLQGDAGKIIQTFGGFVAGGSFVVGMVIFLILVIIQFIVITKGAERISEVSARFTLDAMPGKQMAIDADLNAGVITESQANERRAKIVKESEFYGAMDGASKFIRGDAKAGLVITAVNIVGGIAMGYSHGMGITDAIKTYSILSIGDGLVSQIPSLVISVSSGFLVTKISSSHSVGEDISRQFLKAGQPLLAAACIIGAMAFVPGMPKVQFLLLGGAVALVGRTAFRAEKKPLSAPETPAKKTEKEPVEELLDMDRISVHVGVRLITLVDPRKSNTIFERIGALRRQFAQHLGIVIPLVRLRDDLNLEPNAYEIRLSEIPVAKGRLEPEMFLAMDPGGVREKVEGIKTTEPVYGLPAIWVSAGKKETAELNGYTVIDPESVFITHLSETLKRHADELLTREDVQLLVDRLRKNQPSLVGEIVGADGDVSIALLQRVLKNLLKGGIPVRELTAILESLAENASKTKNANTLTEVVRKSLSRTITEQYRNAAGKIVAITFDPSFEHQLTGSLSQEGGELTLNLPADVAMELNRKMADAWRSGMDQGSEKLVLLCDARLRAPLARMLARTLPMLPVVAYDEIVLGTEVESIETIVPQEKAAPAYAHA